MKNETGKITSRGYFYWSIDDGKGKKVIDLLIKYVIMPIAWWTKGIILETYVKRIRIISIIWSIDDRKCAWDHR